MNMDLNNIPENYQKDIKKATNLLKNEGGKTVYLFGSMVTGKVHKNSDIDIGVKGLPPEKFFRAYSKLYMNLDNEIDLVDFDYDNQLFSLLERLGEVVEVE
jgi:predicted nucleotidyltransferase